MKRVFLTILMVVVLSLAVLYYLDNLGSLSTISFTEVIFEDVEELKFLDAYTVKELQPQDVDLSEMEAYYCKLISYEQNEYLVAG